MSQKNRGVSTVCTYVQHAPSRDDTATHLQRQRIKLLNEVAKMLPHLINIKGPGCAMRAAELIAKYSHDCGILETTCEQRRTINQKVTIQAGTHKATTLKT